MKVTDADILDAISTCSRTHTRLRGVRVRELLYERFGTRAGRDRVYRLVRQFQATESATTNAALVRQIKELNSKLEEAEARIAHHVARADLAEHREQAHFDRFANELYELREFKTRYGGPGGMKFAAERTAEQLRLLTEITRSRQYIAELEALLSLNGIKLPKPVE